ncbi:MAG: hypothetical protein ABSD78_01580 [Acidimicrobiales bacterium]
MGGFLQTERPVGSDQAASAGGCERLDGSTRPVSPTASARRPSALTAGADYGEVCWDAVVAQDGKPVAT